MAKTKVRSGLSPYTLPEYERFAALANKFDLHPLDWKRFYEFVITCHTRRLKRTGDQLRRTFREAGFSDHSVEEMVLVYDHGRALLKLRAWR